VGPRGRSAADIEHLFDYAPSVAGGSAGSRWQRVRDARQQAREALGRVPNQTDLFDAPRKSQTPLRTPEPPQPVGDPYARPDRVLSMGEAASRLGLSRAELDAMIATGKIEALPTGFTQMIRRERLNVSIGIDHARNRTSGFLEEELNLT
jgi:hypothetical protein